MKTIGASVCMLVLYVISVQGCGEKLDIAIVLDSSTTVGEDLFESIKDKFVDFVNGSFTVGNDAAHFGVIHFDTKAHLDIDFNDLYDKESIQEAIKGIEFKPGGTRLDLALIKASNALFGEDGGTRPDVPKFLIIATDGILPQMLLEFWPITSKLKTENKHLHVLVLGVGPHVDIGNKKVINKEELDIFVDGKAENLIPFSSFDGLAARIQILLYDVCMGME